MKCTCPGAPYCALAHWAVEWLPLGSHLLAFGLDQQHHDFMALNPPNSEGISPSENPKTTSKTVGKLQSLERQITETESKLLVLRRPRRDYARSNQRRETQIAMLDAKLKKLRRRRAGLMGALASAQSRKRPERDAQIFADHQSGGSRYGRTKMIAEQKGLSASHIRRIVNAQQSEKAKPKPDALIDPLRCEPHISVADPDLLIASSEKDRNRWAASAAAFRELAAWVRARPGANEPATAWAWWYDFLKIKMEDLSSSFYD